MLTAKEKIMPDNFGRMTSDEAPKRSPRRMSYDDVFQVIAKYACEMQPYYADGWSRFPQGGNAAMIANYLNDKADFYRIIDANITNDLLDAATEIIVRCG